MKIHFKFIDGNLPEISEISCNDACIHSERRKVDELHLEKEMKKCSEPENKFNLWWMR